MKKNFLIAIMLSVSLALAAHPGRTDKNGGHNSANGYHYHNKNSSPAPSITKTPEEKYYIMSDFNRLIYHRENCELIKGEKVTSIDRKIIQNPEFEACLICIPFSR